MGIVLISSVALLAIGGGAALFLVKTARESTLWAEFASSTTVPAKLMVLALEEERRLSVLHLAGDASAVHGLVAVRQRSDQALAAIVVKGEEASELNPDGSGAEIEGYSKLFAMVPTLRAGVDSRRVSIDEVFRYFTQVIGVTISASTLAARVAPDAPIAIELSYCVELLRAAEALSQADTIGAVALTTGELTAGQFLEFSRLVGEFRAEVAYSATILKDARLSQLHAITNDVAWQQVIGMQDALLLRGPVIGGQPASTAVEATATLPMSLEVWQKASGHINAALQKVWEDQGHEAHAIARDQGKRAARDSLLGGLGVLLVATLAFLSALVLANRFIGRMYRLHNETLELADQRMPALFKRLSAGEDVDATSEQAPLDFGTDELGRVAAAFNRAHFAAVSATIAEAKTRAGINTVFLNIAHRSQLVVHRQLELLDQAERTEENPRQLELLFQLDHLATRSRRNAENLIILGGEQPGRRWRNLVPLLDVVRGAVSESMDYARIRAERMPETRIAGHAVADVVHLLAELMDNATACSPPATQVTVSGMTVGRGVVVEITDQGLGMSEGEFAEHNSTLADPPDFSVAAVSGNTRLGLFVVAKLAGQHGISVRLNESAYGGVRAVVLIPSALMESAAAAAEFADGDLDVPEPAWSKSGKPERFPAVQAVESPNPPTWSPSPGPVSAITNDRIGAVRPTTAPGDSGLR
ncbi:nitrate- and nitrite sensing domain-containing protein [Nocardia sp. NPDC057663]|uniref:sensor histidine kinase n=1 Tax=Nocardia sp. NPDC057663 TaxID=3346201 RepID=UPI00366B8418